MLTLTEAQLDWLCEHIPDAPRSEKGGRPVADKRQVIRGIFWILGNGAKWKDLPAEFGSKSTVHRWFKRWAEQGVFEQLMRRAARRVNDPGVPGDDGVRQVRSIEHERVAGGTLLEGRSFTWDAAGNKTSHNDLRTSFNDRRNRTLSYDAANRLAVSGTAFPGDPSQDGTVTYTLDGVHNRLSVALSGSLLSRAPLRSARLSSGGRVGCYTVEHWYKDWGQVSRGTPRYQGPRQPRQYPRCHGPASR